MTAMILVLLAAYLLLLVGESRRAARDRAAIPHIVHVNGIRGKSSTARLIAAGLAAGGLRTYCKTTGTDPMTIDVNGVEAPIRRVGCTNIREQLGILHRAAAQNAEVLVVECMAVQPELQRVAQHRMLKADIGVITNVRRDHTDVMGDTLPEIADALANTVPQNGVLFTAENEAASLAPLAACAKRLNTRFVPVTPDDDTPRDIDFADNVALALAVCAELGVPRDTAIEGLRRYHPDPYTLSVYRLGDAPGVLFVNALSANDIQSTRIIYDLQAARWGGTYARPVLLLNNRAERGSRTRDMLALAVSLHPKEIFLLGAAQGYLTRELARRLPGVPVRRCKNDAQKVFNQLAGLPAGSFCFAAGNIANGGRALIAAVRERGERLV